MCFPLHVAVFGEENVSTKNLIVDFTRFVIGVP